jgi:hypothetical protein
VLPLLLQAAVHHPLWNNGHRCYSRFFGWAYGDGALIPMYPQLTYLSWPYSAEVCWLLLLLAAAAHAIHVLLQLLTAGLAVFGKLVLLNSVGSKLLIGYDSWMPQAISIAFVCAALGFKTVDVLLDVLRAFHPIRRAKHPTASHFLRIAAAAEASLVKSWSETGRLWGHLQRGELSVSMLFSRFDWFCGLSPAVVAAEQQRAGWRFLACCVGAWWLAAACSGGVAGGPAASAAAAAAVIAGCGIVLWRLEG